MLPGCLVDDPPPYDPPKKTPPRLDYRRADPLLDGVLTARTGDSLTFRIPVASEDAGDNLVGFLLLDYSAASTRPPDILTIPQVLAASTADDTSRAFGLDWLVDTHGAPGCHRVTLRVTHRSNLDILTPNVVDKSDLAEAYWWLNIDSDPAFGNSLVDCPGTARGTP
jgi:hypothetical protein